MNTIIAHAFPISICYHIKLLIQYPSMSQPCTSAELRMTVNAVEALSFVLLQSNCLLLESDERCVFDLETCIPE